MIYLLDKPLNWTSFDLVKKVRNLVSEKKVGHAGTLDPLATGLMIIATGSDTKKLADLVGLDKTYVAKILIGRSTNTLDQEGEILESNPETAIQLNESMIRKKVDVLRGSHRLSVPLYSAVKVDGKPLYRYAREGKSDQIEIPSRLMVVNESNLINIEKTPGLGVLITIELSVASGVYIRSLASYLGELLNCPAMLWELRRTRIGQFDIADSQTIKELEARLSL